MPMSWPTSWKMRSMLDAEAASCAVASMETYSILRLMPEICAGGGGMTWARIIMAQARSMMGVRTSFWMRSNTGPSITSDSDLRISHSTAVMLDRVSNWDATW